MSLLNKFTGSSSSSLESKLREFQYKFCIVFTKDFGIMQSPLCTFYQKEDKSNIHFLFSFKESCEFWKPVLCWFQDNDINVGELKEVDLSFGSLTFRMTLR